MSLLKIRKGTIIKNRYRIEDLLGQGGFGSVHKGRDQALEIPVAVKMLFDNSPDLVKLFQLEAKILARLKHPNLPRVTDYFSEGNRHFLVMDYIDGRDLQSILDGSGKYLDYIDVCRWMDQILNALDYIHKRDIVHRDVKPGNIRINSSGIATLVDFGIAKKGSRLLTAPGAGGAFTMFMAPPEQCNSSGKTTPASDVYSVGATMYYLLTYHFPADAVSRLMGRTMDSPETYNQKIPPALSNVIIKAMSLVPRDRYKSAEIMKIEIRNSIKIQSPNATSHETVGSTVAPISIFRREIRRK